jgi:hypothetical protein
MAWLGRRHPNDADSKWHTSEGRVTYGYVYTNLEPQLKGHAPSEPIRRLYAVQQDKWLYVNRAKGSSEILLFSDGICGGSLIGVVTDPGAAIP